MKKFKVAVTRIDEYIVSIDENLANQEWMDHFKKYFYDFNTLEEHAEHIAQYRARFGEGFIEGYGDILINGKPGLFVNEDKVNKAFNIRIISEDNNIETEAEEI
jgi:hypothetical protein